MSFCRCDTCGAAYGCNQHQRAQQCRISVRAFTRALPVPECADYVARADVLHPRAFPLHPFGRESRR